MNFRNAHDGRTFGSQTIHDNRFKLNLKTDFVKVAGGENGGNWALRVSGTPAPNDMISIIFYVGTDGNGELMNVDNKIVGKTLELGDFSVEWNEKDNNENVFLRSLEIPRGKLWKIKYFTQKFISENANQVSKQKNPQIQDILAAGTMTKSDKESHNVLLFQGFFKKDFQVSCFINSSLILCSSLDWVRNWVIFEIKN